MGLPQPTSSPVRRPDSDSCTNAAPATGRVGGPSNALLQLASTGRARMARAYPVRLRASDQKSSGVSYSLMLSRL